MREIVALRAIATSAGEDEVVAQVDRVSPPRDEVIRFADEIDFVARLVTMGWKERKAAGTPASSRIRRCSYSE